MKNLLVKGGRSSPDGARGVLALFSPLWPPRQIMSGYQDHSVDNKTEQSYNLILL